MDSGGNGSINIAKYGGTATTLGQKAMAASAPVVLASDQPTIPVSLATLPALVAGTALIGKVGIDQTTPGTTNGVSLGYLGANAVATGTGASSSGTQRDVLTNDYLSTATVNNLRSSSASTPNCSSVTGVASDVLAANAARKRWDCKVDSGATATVYFAIGATATALKMPFQAGDAYGEASYNGAVSAIAASGTQTVCCWEVL